MIPLNISRLCGRAALTAFEAIAVAGAACAVGSLIAQIGSHNFYGYGQAKVTQTSVAGEPFKSGCIIATASGGKSYWNSGAAAPATPVALRKGEHLVVSFYVRAISPATAKIEVSYEQASAPYQSSARRTVTATKRWQKVVLPVTAVNAYPAGTTHVVFHTGFGKEMLELADVVVAK